MKNYTLGVSLNESSLRCALVEEGEEGISISSLFEIEYENFENAIKDVNVIKALREFVRKSRYNKCVVSLPSSKVLTRIKTVPKIPESKIVKLIQTEIRDYAIFEKENVSLGFSILEDRGDEVDIIWAGIKEPVLVSVLQFLKASRIKASTITIPQLALVEFVNTLYSENDAYAVLNVDKESTTLTVSKGKRIVFNYTQDLGYDCFEKGDLSLKGTWVGNIVSTLSYVSRNLNTPVKEVFVSVNNPDSFDILPFLSQRIPSPALLLTIPESVGFSDESVFLKIQKTGGNEYAVPIGLALLSKLKKGEVNYLSITEHFLREKVSERLKVLTTVLVLVAVNGGAILVYPFLRDSINSTNAQLSNVLKSISEISKPAEDATKLGQDLQNLKGALSKIKEVESSINVNPPYSIVLKEFKSLSPGGVYIIEIALKDDSSISLRGNSNTMRNVFNFEENLSKATYIYNATVLSVYGGKTNEFTFEMQANMRKGK